ncbi:prepilin peptidase [Candidatus Woesearchaeota archaeon]|nr:prepilin peptidase [Candidatus Woesearchaeota archaeon]
MEFFIIIMFILAFVLLLLGSYTDFKIREVPDYLSYGMIIAGIGLRALYSAMTLDYWIILEGILGLGIMLGIGCAMFYLGQWGGGDSKVLMALGSLIGIQLTLDQFMLSFFLNLLIIGGIFGTLWCFGLAYVHRKKFVPEFLRLKTEKNVLLWRRLALLVAAFLIIYSFFVPLLQRIAVVLLALLVLLSSYTFIFIKGIENVCMYKKIPVSQLREGDWIAEEIILNHKKIVGPKDLGISKEQITILQNSAGQGKIKQVLIKEGMPFVPAFFITLIVTFFTGNIFFLLL